MTNAEQGTPLTIESLQRDTKQEIQRRAAELADLRRFEQAINPRARPRRKRRKPQPLSITGGGGGGGGEERAS